MKIGKVRAWEYHGASSSSSGDSGDFKEVEVGLITRRVQSEAFQVTTLESQKESTDLKDLVVGALAKRLQKAKPAPETCDNQASFSRVPVLADGLCFWHSILRCCLPEEFGAIERAESGGPTAKDRLDYEIKTAKTAHEEFVKLYSKSAKVDPIVLKAFQDSYQVEIEHLQLVCETSDLALRVSLSEEAGLAMAKHIHRISDNILRETWNNSYSRYLRTCLLFFLHLSLPGYR